MISVLIADESEGEGILAQVFGEPQVGSFTRRLSPTGNEPATKLAAYARGLDDDQAAILLAQSTIASHEGSWAEGVASSGLTLIEPDDN